MTIIWGTNYSIVKSAFREIDPQAFNAVRMTIASAVFLAIIVAPRSGARARRAARASSSRRRGSPAATGWSSSASASSATSLSVLLHRRPGADERRQQLADARGDAGRHRADERGARARADRRAALGRRALSMLGIYIVVGRGVASAAELTGRPDDGRGGAVLGDLHARRAAADRAALAGRRHRPVDDHRHARLRAGDVGARRGHVPWTRTSVAHVDLDRLFVDLRARRRLHDLVCGGAPDRQRADLRLLERRPDRRDGDRRRLLGEPLG